MASDLKYFMVKLHTMEKALGVNATAKKAQIGKTKDDFLNGEHMIMDLIREIQKMQVEREERMQARNNGPSIDTIKMGSQIRDKIKDLREKISHLERALMTQRSKKNKFTPENLQNKEKRLRNYKTHLKIAEERDRGDLLSIEEEEPPLTLEQLKMQIENDKSTNADIRYKDEDLTAEEQNALNVFAQNDAKQNKIVDEIDDGLAVLYEKVVKQGEVIDQTNVQVQENIHEVDRTNKQLGLTNKKLKEIVAKYRAPNKFCLDIICILLLLGLAAVLYNMLKK